MDDARDHFINAADVVGSEEMETIAVLQTAKEHRDQLVASDVLLRALLQVRHPLYPKELEHSIGWRSERGMKVELPLLLN